MRQEFPLVYGMSRSGRMLCISLGSITIAAAAAGVVYFGFFYEKKDINIAVMVGLCLAFMLLGLGCIGSVLLLRIRVHADEIESRAFIRVKRMKRADITGFRILTANGTNHLRLESARPGVASLTLPAYVAYDARMDAWLEGATNHDDQERKASLDTILADADLPGGKAEKLDRLARARRIAKGLFFASLALAAWGWIHPSPYLPVVGLLVLMPWVAAGVCATNVTLYRLNPGRNDMGADLSGAFILPLGALAIRAMLDFNLFDAWKATGLTLGMAALCLAVLFLLRVVRARGGELLTFVVLAVAYGFGVVTMANTILDDTAPQYFEVHVLDKSTSSNTFELKLPPWGPRAQEENVSVTRAMYQRISAGDTLCVYLWPGALGVRWFDVLECPKPG